MPVVIKHFFDPDTATFTYVVHDVQTKKAAVIDSVLNYNQDSGRTSTHGADEVISYIKAEKLELEWILETHIHADHLTASHYIKSQLGGKTGIGDKIKNVLEYWIPIFNTHADTPENGSQFDVLFADHATFKLGASDVKVMHTPGHTPACLCYLIEDNVFVGDTIFMPDVGTARTDFPGGSAEQMYSSVQKIFGLPDSTKIYVCHDYPPAGRKESCVSTVAEQKQHNVLINDSVSKAQYIEVRNGRDKGKAVPKLILPSIQTNMRAGKLPNPESNQKQYMKIPLNTL